MSQTQTAHLPEKNNKRTIKAWALFDWANSAYALVISTAIFPVYFTEYAPDEITIMGITSSDSSLYAYSVAFAYFIIACLSPILSGIADFSGRRLFFLKLFTLIGSISCMLLYFFKGEPQLWLGTSAFILATIGFAGSIVFYDSFLPLIVTEDRFDKVSAKGFSYGYIGSVILLIMILIMIQRPMWFGITDAQLPARIGFLMVGLWWLGFAQYTFRHMPRDRRTSKTLPIRQGYAELRKVVTHLKDRPGLKRFLVAFFFYISGVNTVIYVATLFAKKELGFATGELILIVLILQLVAIGGAYLFAWWSGKSSNKISLATMIIIWIIICFAAYLVASKTVFYALAAGVGLVMGGIQSLSRSTYSKMVEQYPNDITSFFSFYDVTYKSAIVIGTWLFGWIEFLTGDIRNSVLAVGGLFVISLIVLFTIDFDKALNYEKVGV